MLLVPFHSILGQLTLLFFGELLEVGFGQKVPRIETIVLDLARKLLGNWYGNN